MATAAAKKSSPEAGVAPVEAPTPEVQPEDVRIEAGQHNRRVIVHMPCGTVGDDIRNPKIWRKVQATRTNALMRLDEIIVLGHDESWYARAICAHATNTEAILCVEKIGTFRAIADQLYGDGKYRVHFRHGSYFVQRIADDVIVDSVGYSTEAQAIRAIDRMYPTRVN